MNEFLEFIENSHLSVESTQEMTEELEKRKKQSNPFPLHVFHPAIKPYLSYLHQKLDLPKSFVGLALLSAYSSAVGTAVAVEMGSKLSFFPVWGCLEGIASSGKSLVIKNILSPLQQIQDDYDSKWLELQERLSKEDRMKEKMHTVMFRDVHIPTLVRSVMPDNPKGVTKLSDEILEFINGMNALSNKEGTDEQFWLSAWNCQNFSGIRSGKDKFVVPRVFANVIGGIQPTLTYKLFAKDRDTSGFIFRFLFAVPEEHKISLPDMSFTMPEQVEKIHTDALTKLYTELIVENSYDRPNTISLNREALQMYSDWKVAKTRKINRMEGIHTKEIHSGVLGKISDYAIRFAGLLNVSDQAYDQPNWRFIPHSIITTNEMSRALELADYFYNSAVEVYERVNESIIAPPDVLRFAAMIHARMSYQKIGDAEYSREIKSAEARKKKAERTLRAMIQKYPKVFRAEQR
jgi:hypothetical protein